MAHVLKLIRRDTRGANLIEMALVSMLLLAMVAGIVDVGRAFNNYIVITNASREAARYASHFPHFEDGIKAAAIVEAAGSSVTLADSDVTVFGLDAPAGSPIEVTVETQVDTIMGAFVGAGSLTLRSSTVMVVFGLDG